MKSKKASTMCEGSRCCYDKRSYKRYDRINIVRAVGDGRGAIKEGPNISVGIAKRTCACWIRNRRYQRDPYEQPNAQL